MSGNQVHAGKGVTHQKEAGDAQQEDHPRDDRQFALLLTAANEHGTNQAEGLLPCFAISYEDRLLRVAAQNEDGPLNSNEKGAHCDKTFHC